MKLVKIEKGSALTYRATEVAGVMAGSAISTYLQNKHYAMAGTKPVDLLFGVTLQSLSVLGVVPAKLKDHVTHLANGALAAYAARQTPAWTAKLGA